jgi:hypothetical protein
MLIVVVVVPTTSTTFTWKYEKYTYLKGDVDEIDELP